MFTLFTTAKPFSGQSKVAQINALSSWKKLDPDIEIILFGQTEGAAEIVNELGLVYIPEIGTNELGTPLISAMFETAQLRGRFDLQAYINCDIIIMDDFLSAVQLIDLSQYLIVGQRWDLDLNELLDFSGNWQTYLRYLLSRRGVLHPPTGSDYFVYHRNVFNSIPPLVVGRLGWDNWMIQYCLARQIPVLDATPAITAVHQNHSAYTHTKYVNGKVVGVESEHNLSLAPTSTVITLIHANWIVHSTGVKRKSSIRHYIRSFTILPLLYPRRYGWLRLIAWFLRKLLGQIDGRLNGKKWLPEDITTQKKFAKIM